MYQNPTNPQDGSDNSQNFPEQAPMDAKTKITTKIFITLLFYIALFCISFSIFFIFNWFQVDAESRWIYASFRDVMQTVFLFGVAGVVPLLGGSATLFLFPFAPVVVALLVIFSIVSILEKWKIITSHKKIFLSIFVLSIILLGSIKIFDIIKQAQHEKQATKERNYYEQTYETQKPVESKNTFIHPEKNEIVVSDIYGNNKKIIFSYSEENIGYVSPNGKYFANCEPYGQYGDCNSLLSSDNPSQKTDLCIMKTYDDHEVCPEFCNWDLTGSSFVCQYKFYGFLDKNKEKTPSSKKILVLFDPRTGKHKIINQIERSDSENDYTQDFALINSNSLIFTNQGKFYKAENLYNCEIKISEMKNLSECENFILNGNNIYCMFNAEKNNIEIKDKDNFWVEGNDYFIIKQNLEQSSKNDYSIINKAPLPEAETLFSVDDKYIFIIPVLGSIKILDTESGLTRDMGGNLAWDEENVNDKKLIFEKYGVDTDIKKIPKSYLENITASEDTGIQECENSEVPIDKLTKWENNKLSFEYDANDFNIEETKDGMIHLKNKDTGMEYADISSYIIENGLTLDMIFNNTKEMGSRGGYYDVIKKKIGNKEFVQYLLKWQDGRNASMEYKTVINNKYHLQIGNNFAYHVQNTESTNKIEKLIESIWVKNY